MLNTVQGLPEAPLLIEGKQNRQYREKQPFALRRSVLSRLNEMKNFENAVLKALEPTLPQEPVFLKSFPEDVCSYNQSFPGFCCP